MIKKVFLIIGLIILIVMGGYFLFQRNFKSLKQNNQESIVSDDSAKPEKVINEGGTLSEQTVQKQDCIDSPQSDWLIFTDKNIGFQIKYPSFTCDYYLGVKNGDKRVVEAFLRKGDQEGNGYSFYLFDEHKHPFSIIEIYKESPITTPQVAYNNWSLRNQTIESLFNRIERKTTLNINNADAFQVVTSWKDKSISAETFVKINNFIFNHTLRAENTLSPDFFKDWLEWKIFSTIRPL